MEQSEMLRGEDAGRVEITTAVENTDFDRGVEIHGGVGGVGEVGGVGGSEEQLTDSTTRPTGEFPILTARTGTNADLFPDVFALYAQAGNRILDLTYGRGVFWQGVERERYEVVTNDLHTEADYHYDLRATGFAGESFDVVVLDPPYMHGGKTVKASINQCYLNANGSHKSVIALYVDGMREAWRLLKSKGVLIVKCQDEIESGKQQLSHVEIILAAQELGYRVLDLFVLVQPGIPAMRLNYQKSARKNHSYAVVFRRG